MNTATVSDIFATISTRTPYAFDVTNKRGIPPVFDLCPDRHVREDRGFYIPDFLSNELSDDDEEAHAAAMDHAKHLLKAEGLLHEALNLVGLMLAALGDECDSRAMQAEIALKVIETKLSEACNRINKHDRRHTNLFLAYFDLKHKTEGGAD